MRLYSLGSVFSGSMVMLLTVIIRIHITSARIMIITTIMVTHILILIVRNVKVMTRIMVVVGMLIIMILNILL